MKTAAVLALLLASATAFNQPLFATRAVGKKAPVAKAPAAKVVAVKKAAPAAKVVAVKKAAPAAKPAPAKKAPVVKAVAKKVVVAKKAAPAPVKKVAPAPAKKAAPAKPVAPPSSKGYPSFAASAQSFRLGNISGGGSKKITPVFLHPTINTAPAPSFDYKAAAKKRVTKAQEFVFDDGLTVLERKQRATLPAFLTGSAKSNADKSTIRADIQTEEFAFGLDADRFQLLFITAFGLFTLVGCLSGNVSLD